MRQRLQRAFWSLYGRYVWDAEQPSWRQAQITRVVDILASRQTQPGEHVLDTGCGTGNYAVALAWAGFEVVGIDYAAGMLASTQAKLTEALGENLSFLRMDLDHRLDLADATFDHVINISVLQSAADPGFTLRELRRVLRPWGTLLLLHVPRPQSQTAPVRDVIRYRVAHLQHKGIGRVALIATKVIAERTIVATYWTADELRAMLQAGGFAIVSLDPGPPIVIVAERAAP